MRPKWDIAPEWMVAEMERGGVMDLNVSDYVNRIWTCCGTRRIKGQGEDNKLVNWINIYIILVLLILYSQNSIEEYLRESLYGLDLKKEKNVILKI